MMSAVLVAIWATMNGGWFIEFFEWSIRAAPLVSGAITGLLLGDWQAGAMIGATVQLLYMGQVEVGGVSAYDKCYAGIIATGVAIVSRQSPQVAVTIAVSLGAIGLVARNACMTINVFFVHMADKYAEKGETQRIWIYNWLLPQLVTFVFYGIPAFLAVFFGAQYLESFMKMMPAFVNRALEAIGMILPALGIALMFKTVYNTKFISFAMITYLAVAYMKFDIIACSILGGAFALLYWNLNFYKLTNEEE
ncbi:PTS mannose/fructose/sorbose/N-acetylgalactosamine transporter subunit IIC [Enterococcus faecalis]